MLRERSSNTPVLVARGRRCSMVNQIQRPHEQVSADTSRSVQIHPRRNPMIWLGAACHVQNRDSMHRTHNDDRDDERVTLSPHVRYREYCMSMSTKCIAAFCIPRGAPMHKTILAPYMAVCDAIERKAGASIVYDEPGRASSCLKGIGTPTTTTRCTGADQKS